MEPDEFWGWVRWLDEEHEREPSLDQRYLMQLAWQLERIICLLTGGKPPAGPDEMKVRLERAGAKPLSKEVLKHHKDISLSIIKGAGRKNGQRNGTRPPRRPPRR